MFFRVFQELRAIKDDDERLRRLVELNVVEQVRNVAVSRVGSLFCLIGLEHPRTSFQFGASKITHLNAMLCSA